MKQIACPILSLFLFLAGCASPQAPIAPSITTSNSKVVTVASGDTSRTEEYGRNSHSDSQGSQASTHQAARQVNSDGVTREHSSDVNSASKDTVGFSQDEHHIVVTGSNVTREFAVSGQDVAVSGRSGHLVFTGKTHGLSITGDDNHVEVENAILVEVSGLRNQVLYSGPRPEVRKTGNSNAVQSKLK